MRAERIFLGALVVAVGGGGGGIVVVDTMSRMGLKERMNGKMVAVGADGVDAWQRQEG